MIKLLNIDELKEEVKQYICYEKDIDNKIVYLMFDWFKVFNVIIIGMCQYYVDLVFKVNVDDDVKVLVICGEGEYFGSGGDFQEQVGMYGEEGEDMFLLYEFGINDLDVKYLLWGFYWFLYSMMDYYVKVFVGNCLFQEFKKISIIEMKGYCYGWYFY